MKKGEDNKDRDTLKTGDQGLNQLSKTSPESGKDQAQTTDIEEMPGLDQTTEKKKK